MDTLADWVRASLQGRADEGRSAGALEAKVDLMIEASYTGGMKRFVFLAGFVALSFLVPGPRRVLGHPTGHEVREPTLCARLPSPERRACLQCLGRPIKHHYHPDLPAGKRCRPDDGKA